MDEKQSSQRPIQLSLMLVLLLVAMVASLLAVWKLRLDATDVRRHVSGVRLGMTRGEVIQIMGKHPSVDSDEWVYRAEEDLKRREWKTVTSVFEDGQVKDIVSGREPIPPPPQYQPFP